MPHRVKPHKCHACEKMRVRGQLYRAPWEPRRYFVCKRCFDLLYWGDGLMLKRGERQSPKG